MAMFDWVTVRYPIDPAHQDFRWQTKSLPQPNLRQCEVGLDGRVYLDGAEFSPPFDGGFEVHDMNDEMTEIFSYVFRFSAGIVVDVQLHREQIADTPAKVIELPSDWSQ